MLRRLTAVLLSLLLMIIPLAPAAAAEEAGTAQPAQTEVPAQQSEPETPAETPAAEPTEVPTAVPTAEPTAVPTAEPTAVPTAEPTAAPTAEPTAVPTAELTAVPTAEPTVAPTEEPVPELKVNFCANVRYGYADKKAIEATLTISGGVAPYTVTYSIDRGGKALKSMPAESVGSKDSFSYMPTARGYYTVRAVVEDAAGNTAKDVFNIRVAERSRKTDSKWIRLAQETELTGDWGEDLLNVALSQLGNQESDVDFIINDEGIKGYTIYGAYIDGDYRAWCTAFIKWCAAYAQIDSAFFPTANRSRDWKDRIKRLGAYVTDTDEYEPQPGDLIFFNHEGEKTPQHIGIVECVEDGMVCTVEGNLERAVRRSSYPLDHDEIIGYADITLLQQMAEERAAQTTDGE